MKKRVSLFLWVAVCLSAASPKVNTPQAGMDADRLAKIPVRMKEFVDKGTIAGAVTLVARRGRLVHFEAHGLMDIEAKKPMMKDALFRLASSTKTPCAAPSRSISLARWRLLKRCCRWYGTPHRGAL